MKTSSPPRIRPLALVLGTGGSLARGLVRSLAKRDTDLLLVDVDGEGLLALRESLGSLMVHVQLFQCDLAESSQRGELVRFLAMAHSKPDLLLFLPDLELEERGLSASGAVARRLQEAHLTAFDDLLRAGILTRMLQEDNGYILAALPHSALDVQAGRALQTALGAALARYSLCLRQELLHSGVGVTIACVAEPELRRQPGGGESISLAESTLRALFGRKGWVGLLGGARWRAGLARWTQGRWGGSRGR